VDRGGDLIVRLNRAALLLYEPHGERIELLPRLRQLRGDAPREYEAHVKDPTGKWIHGRLLALRRSTQATRWAQKRMQRSAQRRRETVTSESLECAKYFMVWSTLPAAVPVGQILECYRLR